MQPDIYNWLNGNRDYTAGVTLLKKHGKTGFVMTMLEKGPDVFNTPRLLEEIKKLAAFGTQVSVVQPEKVALKTVVLKEATYAPDINIEKTLRIKALIKKLLKETGHFHGQLSILPEGAKLFECASTIIRTDRKIGDLYSELRYFEQNGVWFDDLPQNQKKPFDLEQRIKNLMSSRAKVKKILEKPLHKAKQEHHERRVAEFDKELEKYRSMRTV